MSHHPKSSPDSDEPSEKSLGRRRVLRLLGKALLGSLIGLILLLGAGRLYFSDEKIRHLAMDHLSKAIQTQVEIKALEIKLLEGVHIDGLKISPPSSFSKSPLSWERFFIKWDLLALFQLHVVISEIGLVNPTLNFEQNEGGTNLEALFKSLVPPSKKAAPKKKTEKAPPAFKQPDLPIQITLHKLEVKNATISVTLPQFQAVLPNLSLETSFEGKGTQLALKNAVVLGQADRKAEITLEQLSNRAVIATAATATLNSEGLQKTTFELTMSADATTTLEATGTLPPVPINGQINIEIGLLPPKVNVHTFEWKVGSQTSIQLQAQADSLFEDPRIELQQLKGASNLQDFASLIPFFVPNLTASGELSLTSAPIELRLSQLDAPHTLPLKAPFEVQNLNLSFEGNDVKNVRAKGEIIATGSEFQFATSFGVDSMSAQGNQARGISGSFTAKTPSVVWFQPEAATEADKIQSQATIEIENLIAPAGRIQNVQIQMDSEAPILLLQENPAETPIKVRTQVITGRISNPQASLQKVQLDIDTTAHDLKGNNVQAEIQMRANGARALVGEDAFRLRQINSNLGINKQGQTLEITRGQLIVAQLGTFSFGAALTNILSPHPFLRSVTLQSTPIDLGQSLKLIPPSLRPELEASGKASFSASIHGRLDPIALSAKATPPLVEDVTTQENWEAAVTRYVQFITEWVQRIDNKLPFRAQFEARLQNAFIKTPTASAENVNGRFEINLPHRAPKLEMEFSADDLQAQDPTVELAPTHIREITGKLAFVLEGDTILTQGKADFGYLSDPSLPRPLKNGTARLKSVYRFGGDLLIENLQIDTQGIGLGFKTDGVWVDPLGAILKRDWMGSAPNNIHLKFNWALRANLSPPLTLKQTPATITGNVVMAGEANLHRSLLSLAAMTSFDKIHLQQEEQSVQNLSGTLPFKAEISLIPIDDGVLIAQDLPIGAGKAWLKTDARDIRNDSAGAIFQERLKAYQPSSGLHIDRITSGKYEVLDFKFQGQLDKGILKSNEISMHILGGDIVGEAGFQLTHNQDFAGTFRFQASNMDASYFGALNLKPGPQSELSADCSAQFLFGQQIRDLEADMNVTKIGPDTLDRFLQLLDPDKANPAIQDYRKYLPLITIDEVAVWIRHENMNMDLLYTTLLRIPGTQIGFRPIDREMIRRFSLSELVIDPYMQKQVDQYVGPLLGWKKQ